MTKQAIKKVLNERIEEAAYQHLTRMKNTQSKGRELVYKSLKRQNYMRAESRLAVETMCKIFQIRSRNLPVKCNAPGRYDDRKCVVTECNGEDSQRDLFSCRFLEPINMLTADSFPYDDIFSNDVNKQVRVTQIIFQKYQSRAKYLASLSEGVAPGDREG